MAKFIIEQGFWELFPEAEIGVVTACGVDNKLNGQDDVLAEIGTLLEGANWEAKRHLTREVFSENPVIAVWRQAYQKFKTKKGVRCSIEALLKRVEKGNPVSSINPLVDIYNAVSLTYGIPCGGEDMDSFQGDLVLTIAQGGEAFMALGDEAEDPALPGEVIYRDDLGAVCRCWNWRDGQRTMLTPDTTRAFLIIESVDPTRKKAFQEATEQLTDWVHRYTGAEVEITFLHQTNREMEL
jgi:DNA/RNA-binding domain of Phe-tRNA-synthetase-like protein